MVCGEALQYAPQGVPVTCSQCGLDETSAISCPAGHYICNSCHSASTLAKLPEMVRTVTGQAPEDILEELLLLKGLPMHGPEHHAMAGLALLIACQKAGTALQEDFIEETVRRSMQIPGGACGYLGACGGAVSLGVAVSLLTEATPLTGLARGLTHRATAAALSSCGDDEARCCKRALRRTVATGRAFLAEELHITLPAPTGSQQCRDMARNKECARQHCPYFRQTGRSILNA